MTPKEIRPYCKVCQKCKPSIEFDKTRNNTYKYRCKTCDYDIEREKERMQYEETKQKIEEQQKMQQQLTEDNKIDYIIYHCPYEDCRLMCVVYKNELNCHIFRCGYNKTNNQQIPQHLQRIECDKLRYDTDIIGCARPYRFEVNAITPIICDYI